MEAPVIIEVPLDEYKSLIDDRKWRSCLEAGGVDNWTYYYDSLREGGYFGDEDEGDA